MEVPSESTLLKTLLLRGESICKYSQFSLRMHFVDCRLEFLTPPPNSDGGVRLLPYRGGMMTREEEEEQSQERSFAKFARLVPARATLSYDAYTHAQSEFDLIIEAAELIDSRDEEGTRVSGS